MAKFIFRGQARKKKAKFELFGLQEANLATLYKINNFFCFPPACFARLEPIDRSDRFRMLRDWLFSQRLQTCKLALDEFPLSSAEPP